ncbi:hypothetical protein AB833_31990 [Chromatiales bacterium (ex Bugula neritina AB1)]|nr:hypothetical protein AB833_31990 [Chromatiales bacterium (ex Bugula neritina AB1)]
MEKTQTDIGIVGAGILGLAHAYHAARAGLSVAVFERNSEALGATTRNFGMLAVAAQAEGPALDSAMRTLAHWTEISARADFDLSHCGCLFMARVRAEMDVLEEFADSGSVIAARSKRLAAAELEQYGSGLNFKSSVGGLWCADAWKVDQRNVARKIALWLQREYAVTIHFNTEVRAVELPFLQTSTGQFRCDQFIVCGGDEFSTLFPEAFQSCGITRCELQMLRTYPQPMQWKVQPFVLGGLSIARYDAFAACKSIAALRAYQQQHCQQYLTHGIHVIASQESDGSITIGDSHHYGRAHNEPDGGISQRNASIDELMLQELNTMITLPEHRIQQRWLGHYAYKADTSVVKLSPVNGTTIVTIVNGQGMTHGFAVAEDVINTLLGSDTSRI